MNQSAFAIGCLVKEPAGRLQPAQVLFLDRIRAAGGVAFVARDCLDLMRELNERNQGHDNA